VSKGFKSFAYYQDFPRKIRELIKPETQKVKIQKTEDERPDFGEYLEKDTNSNLLEVGMNPLNRTKAEQLRENTIMQDDDEEADDSLDSQRQEENKLNISGESYRSSHNLSSISPLTHL
jgi:hypothetical protein